MKRVTQAELEKKQKVRIISREEYQEMPVNARIDLIEALIPLGLMAIKEELEKEIAFRIGSRYSRKQEGCSLYRHGSNQGSVRLAGQKVSMDIPRIRDTKNNREISLDTMKDLKARGELDEMAFKRMLYGLSCRDYEEATRLLPEAIGLSASSVSRQFIEASKHKLKELMERDLAGYDIVAIIIDGKDFKNESMVIAVGVTMEGKKVFLGFVQTETENRRSIELFLKELLQRGLDVSPGILAVVDGSKGLISAIKSALNQRVLIQRCQWHKRENVISHLAKKDQGHWRKRLQKAYSRPTYQEAFAELSRIKKDLEMVNLSAVASLDEGFEETLTLHRLEVFPFLSASLKTSNCIESINSLIEQRCGKIDYWKNSSQKQRWLAAALLDIEPRLQRIRGHQHLPLLRDALQKTLGITSPLEMAG